MAVPTAKLMPAAKLDPPLLAQSARPHSSWKYRTKAIALASRPEAREPIPVSASIPSDRTTSSRVPRAQSESTFTDLRIIEGASDASTLRSNLAVLW